MNLSSGSRLGPYEIVGRLGAGPASVGGGTLPRWSPDSRELYFVNEERFFALSVSGGDPPHIGPALGPREFIALQRLPDSGIQTRIHLIVNWFEELRRLATDL